MIRYLILLTVIITGSVLISCNSKRQDTPEQANGAITLESVKLTDLSGKEIDPDEFKGKTVFINFWATWCKPCIQEMPSIDKARQFLKDQNIVFLLASNETTEHIQNFKEKRQFQFRYVQVQNLEALNVQALPTTFIFNPKGELVFSEPGIRMWDAPENIKLITKHSDL